MLPFAFSREQEDEAAKGKGRGIEAMANMESVRPQSSDSSDAEEAFGWQLFHDRQRNLVYYLHSHTGEVRWPRPETVGFVMHGLKPLPARAEVGAATDSSSVNPDIWSPYYPHVVMLPSGLMQVHPGPGAEARGASEMWCGYNRFPLAHFGTHIGGGAFSGLKEATESNSGGMVASRTRMLPPTWEESRDGSPFLPPYPVTILGRESTEGKRVPPIMPASSRLEERFHTPEIEIPRATYPIYKGNEPKLEGVDVSMSWSAPSRGSSPQTRSIPTGPALPSPEPSTRRQQDYSRGIVAPRSEKKEHNRKGYLLRQARKMMRDGASSTAAPSKQLKQHEAKSRHEFDRGLENKRDVFNPSSDFDSVSPLHC